MNLVFIVLLVLQIAIFLTTLYAFVHAAIQPLEVAAPLLAIGGDFGHPVACHFPGEAMTTKASK